MHRSVDHQRGIVSLQQSLITGAVIATDVRPVVFYGCLQAAGTHGHELRIDPGIEEVGDLSESLNLRIEPIAPLACGIRSVRDGWVAIR